MAVATALSVRARVAGGYSTWEEPTRHIVGAADGKITSDKGDVVVTHTLGSCLAITAHDASASVGGMLHVMLPLSRINPEKARSNPFMFVDTGVPHFFRGLYAAGASSK